MFSEDLDILLKDGFSRKFASYYLDLAKKEYENPAFSADYVKWSHSLGFLAESAAAYNLSESNYSTYLSDYDYYRIWPLNAWTRIWINDKLTLKYMLSNSRFSEFMPKYYYYTSSCGLRKLIDAPNQLEVASIEEFKRLLCTVGEFACKPCNGTTSLGFIRLSFEQGRYYVNGNEIKEEDIPGFISDNPNYVFTEYLRPSKQFSKYSPHIHTLRIVTINEDGNNPVIIGGYLRIPHKYSGEANYIIIGKDNLDKFNVVVDVNFQTGEFGPAKLTYANRTETIDSHPDTGESIHGVINNYDDLRSTVLAIARRFSTIELMGFDIGITDDGFKCMEINSHPGIKYMQIFRPLLEDRFSKDYFQKRICYVNNLSSEEIIRRNSVIR